MKLEDQMDSFLDAKPRDRYTKYQLVSRPLREDAPSVCKERKLLTSIRVESGRCSLLPIHLHRLKASALMLGYDFDCARVRSCLEEIASKQLGQPPSKVCLIVSFDGSWTFEGPEVLLPDASHLQAMLWPDPVDSRDPLIHHRTTPRPIYDRVLQEVQSLGFIDSIFHNEQGYVTEGATHNILIRHGSTWRTPPLSAGVLPGVYRQYLLKKKPRLREENFTIAQLLLADEVWLSSALRGIRKASIAPA